MLPSTWLKWTQPALTPAIQAGARFTYPGGMEGWVDLSDWYCIPRWFIHMQTVTHPSTNPAVLGRELNSQPVDHESDALTTTPPCHQLQGERQKRQRYCKPLMERTPWHSYGVSLAMWDHTVLPATRHKRIHPAFTPAKQAGTRKRRRTGLTE